MSDEKRRLKHLEAVTGGLMDSLINELRKQGKTVKRADVTVDDESGVWQGFQVLVLEEPDFDLGDLNDFDLGPVESLDAAPWFANVDNRTTIFAFEVLSSPIERQILGDALETLARAARTGRRASVTPDEVGLLIWLVKWLSRPAEQWDRRPLRIVGRDASQGGIS